MSEKLHHGAEFKVEHNGEAARQHIEKLRAQAEHEKQHGSAEHLSHIQKKVEQEAVSGKELAPKAEQHNQASTHMSAGKDLKNLTFNRTLVRIRKRLNRPEKALSAIIHQPAVDKVSEIAANTIARPTGLFGGGLLALVGTSTVLYLTRKHGYEFNYLVFVMLFVAGFAIGSLLELIVKLALRRK